MPSIESSVIIPVYNQWELTRACLKALAATTKGHAIEVIVVDNASQDATPTECVALGSALFGDTFHYHRAETNLNFGPATNLGARMAKGEFLVFLNNDTVPLPNWYQPLLNDFKKLNNIAATGPVLLYPPSKPFGHTVQHLGVFVDPFLKVGHLYEGIPAESPLARRRRFFQIITAACMMVPRRLFLDNGLFDEHFINGAEDIDFCCRIGQKGFRMTVNPEARVIHYTSQTPGRHDYEEQNGIYFSQHTINLLVPDWHRHINDDGLTLSLSPWQTFFITDSVANSKSSTCALEKQSDFKLVKQAIIDRPFALDIWPNLLETCKNPAIKLNLLQQYFAFFPAPEKILPIIQFLNLENDKDVIESLVKILLTFCKPFATYKIDAESKMQSCHDKQLGEIAMLYENWLRSADEYNSQFFQPFFKLTSFCMKKWQITTSSFPEQCCQ